MIKVEVVSNGTIKLVLIPEVGNVFDEAALEMLSKGEVEVTYVTQATQILDKQVDKHLVIKPKTR